MWAANPAVAKLLLDAGARHSFPQPDGQHRCHVGSRVRSTGGRQVSGRCRRLLDSASQKGYTALGLAAERGHADVVEYLIERGLDVNHRDVEGNTPLIWASTPESGSAVARPCAELTAANRRGSNALWRPPFTAAWKWFSCWPMHSRSQCA